MLLLLLFAFLGALGYAIIYTIIYDGGAWCDRFQAKRARNKFLNHRRENDELNRRSEARNMQRAVNRALLDEKLSHER